MCVCVFVCVCVSERVCVCVCFVCPIGPLLTVASDSNITLCTVVLDGL